LQLFRGNHAGQILEIPLGTVKSRIDLALRSLRGQLVPEELESNRSQYLKE
jgi:DNA-directed RNA polymerase specialized sigma24 family protein